MYVRVRAPVLVHNELSCSYIAPIVPLNIQYYFVVQSCYNRINFILNDLNMIKFDNLLPSAIIKINELPIVKNHRCLAQRDILNRC